MRNEDECKIESKLHEVHGWAHACLKEMTLEELHRVHEVGNKILDLINALPDANPIKFLAMFEVISVGVDLLEHTNYRPDSTVTIH